MLFIDDNRFFFFFASAASVRIIGIIYSKSQNKFDICPAA